MKHSLAVLFFAVPLMAQFGGARRVTPQGATLPAKCATGDLFQKTGASAGLYNCSGRKAVLSYLAGRSGPWWWERKLAAQLGNNAGFFPVTDDALVKFSELLLADMADVDVLGVAEDADEATVNAALAKLAPKAAITPVELPFNDNDIQFLKLLKQHGPALLDAATAAATCTRRSPC